MLSEGGNVGCERSKNKGYDKGNKNNGHEIKEIPNWRIWLTIFFFIPYKFVPVVTCPVSFSGPRCPETR